MQTDELKHTIVEHYAGSIAYGTVVPSSDVDIRGIFCAGPESIRTPYYPVREVTLKDHEDGKVYELSNFMKLYTDGNPNIIETLWVDKADVTKGSDVYDFLKGYRSELLSSKIAFTFSGYAVSQLKRIRGHHKWINNPQPEKKPMHKDFLKLVQNFTNKKILPREFNIGDFSNDHKLVYYGSDVFGLVKDVQGHDVFDKQGDFNISSKQGGSTSGESQNPTIIFRYIAEEYKQAKERHTNYWTWKNNRNKKRGELEEKFGYDCKHAMHLVRLLRMGEEILSGQGVIVKRPDAVELLNIRNGGWTYEEIIEYAQEKDKLIRGELYKNTSLRKKPNIKLASEVLMVAQDLCWSSSINN